MEKKNGRNSAWSMLNLTNLMHMVQRQDKNLLKHLTGLVDGPVAELLVLAQYFPGIPNLSLNLSQIQPSTWPITL